MKRLVSLMLTLVLVLSSAACNATPPAQDDDTAFVKPVNYASVLLVTINPQFRLYLDASGEVLAVEPVNDDAKSLKLDLPEENATVEAVVETLVTGANDGGFIKQEATIQLEITETVEPSVDTAAVLDKAAKAADKAVIDLAVTATVETKAPVIATTTSESDASTTEMQENTTATTGGSTASTVVTTTAATAAVTTTAATTVPTTVTTTTEATTVATTTTTTTLAPTTTTAVSYTSVAAMNGRWAAMYLVGNELYDVSFTLCGEVGVGVSFGDALSVMPEMDQEMLKPDSTLYNGDYYYFGRGDGDGLESVSEDKTAITLTDFDGNKLQFTRTGEHTLTVSASPDNFSILGKVPTGVTLTFTTEE